MATTIDDTKIIEAFTAAMQEIANETRERFIKDSLAEYEKVLRQKVFSAAIDIADFYRIERNEKDTVISVRIQK